MPTAPTPKVDATIGRASYVALVQGLGVDPRIVREVRLTNEYAIFDVFVDPTPDTGARRRGGVDTIVIKIVED